MLFYCYITLLSSEYELPIETMEVGEEKEVRGQYNIAGIPDHFSVKLCLEG